MMKLTRINIWRLAKEYMEDKNVHEGFITNEWIEKVNDALGLKELSDEELCVAWDMVFLTLDNECLIRREDNKIDEYFKWADVKSAFTEVVNIEARHRRGEC